jgi:hypothetical protein
MAVKLLLFILCMTDPNQHPYQSYQTVASWLAIGIVVLLQLGWLQASDFVSATSV